MIHSDEQSEIIHYFPKISKNEEITLLDERWMSFSLPQILVTFKSMFGKKLKIYLNTKKCTSENCLGVFSDTLKNVNDDSKLLPVNNDPGEKEKCFIF